MPHPGGTPKSLLLFHSHTSDDAALLAFLQHDTARTLASYPTAERLLRGANRHEASAVLQQLAGNIEEAVQTAAQHNLDDLARRFLTDAEGKLGAETTSRLWLSVILGTRKQVIPLPPCN